MQTALDRPAYLRSALLVLLILVTLAATCIGSTRECGERSCPTDERLSARYVYYAIPIALSQLVYHHDHDYTGYASVSLVFWGNAEAGCKPLKQLLAEAAALDEAGACSSPTWIIPADDKGLVDFTWLAFGLFGIQLKSLNLMFLLVLAAGTSIFVLDHFRRPAWLALLAVLLASFYALTFLIRATNQFGTAAEPRAFDLLSLIPAMHLLTIVCDRRRAKPLLLLLASLDAFLILFIYHARATVAWQILLLWVCILAIWLVRGEDTNAGRVPGRVGRRVTSLVRLAWPGLLVVAGMCCLQGYKGLTYHPLYFQKHGAAHVFWHNTLMGLASNPRLAERYGLTLNDVDTVRAVEAYLHEHGDEQNRAAIYDDPHVLDANFEKFDWLRYEPAARDFYGELWARHADEMLWTYLYYKPRALAATMLWALGWQADGSSLPAALGSMADDVQRVQHGRYFRPFRWDVLGLMLATLLTGFPYLKARGPSLLLLVAAALVFSAIPGMLVMPVIPYVNATLVLAMTAFYLGSAWGLVLVLAVVQNRLAGNASQTQQSAPTKVTASLPI